MTFNVTSRLSKPYVFLVLCAGLALSGCLGGGGDDGEGDGEGHGGGGGAVPTISGIAAAGAPIVGQVTARDSKGLTFVPATISPTGAYSLAVTGGTAPFILQASGISAGSGNPATYYSIAGSANAANVNITPLTDMVVAQAAGQSPAMLYTNCSATSCSLPAATQVSTAEAAVRTSLSNLFAQFGITTANLDLISSPFVAGAVAGQSPIDVLLDAVSAIADPFVPGSYNMVAGSSTGLGANTILLTLPAFAPAQALPVNPALTPAAVAAASAAAARAVLGGTYSGDYANGTWQIDVSTTGVVTGTAMPLAGNSYAISGTVASDGTATFGNVSNGENFSGAITGAGSVTGTWTNTAQGHSGAFTGARVNTLTAFAGTHSGNYTGADSGSWSVTASAAGEISGTSTSAVDGSSCTVSGVIGNNGSIVMTSSGFLTGGTRCGATFLGRYAKVSGSISGNWTNSANQQSGLFSGS